MSSRYHRLLTSLRPALIITLAFAVLVSLRVACLAAVQPANTLQVRDLTTLSANERLTLPASTKVLIRGKSFTLGVLRNNHAALVASRNRVRTLQLANLRTLAGADLSFTKTFTTKTLATGSTHPAISNAHFVPLKIYTPPPSSPNLPPVPANGAPYPLDYRQFCNSVPATVCLYFPSGVTWVGQDGSGNYQTIDPLITDQGVCSQEGGQMGQVGGYVPQYGCIYSYPSSQTVNFLPPAHGFSESGWCNPTSGNFGVSTSAHGAVRVYDAGASGFYSSWGAVGGGPGTEQFCFLQVKLAQ